MKTETNKAPLARAAGEGLRVRGNRPRLSPARPPIVATFALSLAILAGCGSSAEKIDEGELLQGTRSADADVRYEAVKMLGKQRPVTPEALVALKTALKDKDSAIRIRAAYALAEVGPEAASAVPPLKSMLRDPNTDCRQAAAYALATMGPDAQAALPALKSALRDPNVEVRREVARTMKRIENSVKYEREVGK